MPSLLADQASTQSLSLCILTPLAITQHQAATLSRPAPAYPCPTAARLRVILRLDATHHGLLLPQCLSFYDFMKLSRTLDAPIMTKTIFYLWFRTARGHLLLERPAPLLFISSARRVSKITLWPAFLLRQMYF